MKIFSLLIKNQSSKLIRYTIGDIDEFIRGYICVYVWKIMFDNQKILG